MRKKKNIISELEKVFVNVPTTAWDGDGADNAVLLESIDPQSGREIAKKLEDWLDSLGLKGATAQQSEMYHQNLVGIEGWRIDFTKRTYTRLDSFDMKWLKFHPNAEANLGVATPSQVYEIFTKRLSTIKAKQFGV